MSRFQRQLRAHPEIVVVAGFLTGAAAAFLWRLVRPHPASAYRAALDEQRLAAQAAAAETPLPADTFGDVGPDDLAG